MRHKLSALALVAALVVISASVLPCAGAAADGYPEKAVRAVVGNTAGDTTDLVARVAASALGEVFRQTVIVDGRPGANGNVAAARVAKATPDGYTVLVVSSSFASNASLYPNLAHQPLRDFAPVGRLANVHQLLVVNGSVGVRTVAEFIAKVRANPAKIVIASAGTGSASHLAAELMKVRAGPLNTLHVPYKGSGPALVEVLGGHVEALFVTMPYAYPHVRSGRIRALAVASLKRAVPLPQVPTFDESGMAGFEAIAWNAIVVPAGTPYDTIVRLNLGMTKVASSPAYRDKLAALGAEAAASTPEQLADYLRTEVAKWAQVVKAAGVVLE